MRWLPADTDRLLLVFSDVEMGAGGVLDDFPHSDWLAGILGDYATGPAAERAVDLVFNGDTFDLLKTSVSGHYPRHVTEDVALAKLDRVIAAHPAFFEGIRRFLQAGRQPRRVHFVAGNHDAELVFPAVQRRIAHEIGAEVSFPGFSLDFGDVHIEHGQQEDPMFRVDPGHPTIAWGDRRLLNLPWASVALIDVILPLQPLLFPLDRVRPRSRVLSLLPEVRDLLANAFWRYWTREYLYDVVKRSDPIRRISWTMVKEVMYRFSTFDPDVSGGTAAYQARMTDDAGPRLIVLGHHHQPGWWSAADRKVLQAGCLRNEYTLGADGSVGGMLPKVFVEVWMAGDRPVRSHLVEVDGPPAPPGHMPESLVTLRDQVLPLLAPAEERAQLEVAERAQEARERDDEVPPE